MSLQSLRRLKTCSIPCARPFVSRRRQFAHCDVPRVAINIPSTARKVATTPITTLCPTVRASRCLAHSAVDSRSFASSSRFEHHDDLEKDNKKLLAVVKKLVDERRTLLSELETCSPERHKSIGKRVGELEAISVAWEQFMAKRKALLETLYLLNDPDPSMSSLAAEECEALRGEIHELVDQTFPALVVPPSPTSALSAALELKAGVGGQEACLFLSDLHRMYMRYSSSRNWKTKVLNVDNADGVTVGGIVVEVQGEGAYDELKWESGVHRIQRVPATEAAGRVHTSTVTVAVFPLPVEKDNDPKPVYELKDVKIEFMRARGAGGQHVNKTESAVRLTHLPTGITVAIQDERSQHMNKAKAFRILEARLLHRKMVAEAEENRNNRRRLFKSADRSEKIRTYNAPQDRITDHRVGLTLTGLLSMFDGRELHHFISALGQQHQQDQIVELLEREND